MWPPKRDQYMALVYQIDPRILWDWSHLLRSEAPMVITSVTLRSRPARWFNGRVMAVSVWAACHCSGQGVFWDQEIGCSTAPKFEAIKVERWRRNLDGSWTQTLKLRPRLTTSLVGFTGSEHAELSSQLSATTSSPGLRVLNSGGTRSHQTFSWPRPQLIYSSKQRSWDVKTSPTSWWLSPDGVHKPLFDLGLLFPQGIPKRKPAADRSCRTSAQGAQNDTCAWRVGCHESSVVDVWIYGYHWLPLEV